jgi:hypothetical protein
MSTMAISVASRPTLWPLASTNHHRCSTSPGFAMNVFICRSIV